VRFYAGVPLAGPRGQKIGTFCMVDTKPRDFGEEQVAALVAFAALVCGFFVKDTPRGQRKVPVEVAAH
jgi:hypothetical protein